MIAQYLLDFVERALCSVILIFWICLNKQSFVIFIMWSSSSYERKLHLNDSCQILIDIVSWDMTFSATCGLENNFDQHLVYEWMNSLTIVLISI